MTAHEPMTWYMGKMRPRAEVEHLQAEEAATAPPAPEPDSPSTDVSPIPEQLRECRFILVKARDKPAIEKGWQTTANYAYDDPRLLAHIAAGGNYGVMPAGGVCILDADKTMRLAELGVLDRLLDTFVVKTGRTEGQGSHFYIRCPDAPAEKFILRDPETRDDLGDLRGAGHPSFCVGPGCTHPSGGRYEIVSDAPLLEIPWAVLKAEIVDRCTPPEPEVELPAPRPRRDARNKTISEELDLRVSDWLMPRNPRTRGTGEIEGEHPVHGSETGSNLTISADDQEWYCRRHETGGGPLEAFAVAEGMIDCADVRPGRLQDRIPEILDRLKLYGYEQKLKEARLERLREAHRQREAPVSVAATPTRVAPQSSATDYSRFFTIGKNGGVALLYSEIGAYLRDAFAALTFNKTIYLYDHDRGLYIENVGQIESAVQEIAEAVGFAGRITQAKREVLSYVHDHTIETEYPFNAYPGIPVANGVVQVNLATGEIRLEPYSPEMRFTYKMPVVYDPAAPSDAIDAVLRQWVDPVDVPILYQIPAQAILHQLGRKKPYKKCYLLHGDQDAGKTTYLELNYCTFGAENCAGVALQRIGTDRFYKGALESKVFNIYDDLGDVPFDNTGAFKALTGGFEHDIERKGKDSYKGRIFAVHVFTCNKPPAVDDRNKSDSAFWSRWEYLTFPNSFPRDPSFHDRVFTPENISGYFNKVLETVIQIAQAGALLVDSSAFVVRDRWSFNSDPLYRFIQENLEKDAKGAVPKDDLFDAYIRYCQFEQVDPAKVPMNKDVFAKKLFGYDFGTSKQTVEGARVQMFTGYKWQVSSRFKPGGTDQSKIGGE